MTTNDNDKCRKWKIATIVLAILLLLCCLKCNNIWGGETGTVGAQITNIS